MAFTWPDFFAGWVGGVSGLIVGHPIDTVKVRQQTLNVTSMVAIRNTFKYEGVTGFYKGMLFPLMTMGPSNSLFFGVYANCMHKLTNSTTGRVDLTNPNWKSNVFWAGCIGGLAQAIFTCPVELVKITLQANTSLGKIRDLKHDHIRKYGGLMDCVKNIMRESGIKGFYRGFVPMMMRDVPTSGIYTLTYEGLLPHCYPFSKCSKLWQQTFAGGVAGTMSWVLVLPFDVVKSRIQADSITDPVYKGTIDCARKSYKAEGAKVFFKGFWLVAFRAFPVNAAIFVGYEKGLELCNYLSG